MGTRADFYIGTDPADMEWLGSIAWDGYPHGICEGESILGDLHESQVLSAETEEEYRAALASFFSQRDDVSRPEDGWPWPWEDSRLTDFAYTFDGEKVVCSNFGSGWQVAVEYDSEAGTDGKARFPDMERVWNVALGKRSGLITIVGAGADGSIEIV